MPGVEKQLSTVSNLRKEPTTITYDYYLLLLLLYIVCMFCFQVCPRTACVQCPQRPAEGDGDTEMSHNGCELPCDY